MQPSNDELMQRVKDGDMSAFDIIVRRWEYRLFNLVYKMVGDPETTKDTCQEVFLQVYRAAKRYKPLNQFDTWIYRIAVNCSINKLKKMERHRTFPLTMLFERKDGKRQNLADTLPDPEPRPDEVAQQNEVAEHVRKALSRLPYEQRVVIILRHYEGLKFQQIASILNCPIGTVKSRMYYGLDQLRTMLRQFYQ